MVSLDALLALVGPSKETDELRPRRPRHDWVRGEVQCLMCGRLLGRLLGTAHHRQSAIGSTWHSASFFAYRPADTSLQTTPFRPGMRFRCADCGGTGALDDVEYFSTYDELPATAQDEEPVRRGPGRPRRPMPAIQPAPVGLAVALTALTNNVAQCRRTSTN